MPSSVSFLNVDKKGRATLPEEVRSDLGVQSGDLVLLERTQRGTWEHESVHFFRSDEEPLRAVLDKLAQGGGTTYVSISRPGEDRHYQVDRRVWSRRDFRPGAGFTGRPAPPARLLYPFRNVALLIVLSGIVFFALLPGPRRPGRSRTR